MAGREPLHLNLGSNDDIKPGYANVDLVGSSNVFAADLSLKWPWQDSSVDSIYAKDIFEHIDNPEYRANRGKIWVMNESWRVLKPGGYLELLVPCVHLRCGSVNTGAFADPTHVSFWTFDDRYYFCEQWNHKNGERGRLGPSYGIVAVFREITWTLMEYGEARERRSKIHAVLEAVK